MKKMLMLMSVLALGTAVHAEKMEFESENIIGYDMEAKDSYGETNMYLTLNCQKVEGLSFSAASEIGGAIVTMKDAGYSEIAYGIEEDFRLNYAVMDFLTVAAGVNYDRSSGMEEGDVTGSVYLTPAFKAGMFDIAMENEFRFSDPFYYYHDLTIDTELEKIGLSIGIEHEFDYQDEFYTITETQALSKGLVEKKQILIGF